MIAAAFVFLWLDAQTGQLGGGDWPEPERAAPMGSLVKPFVALAYAQSHGLTYPEVDCRQCWAGRSHGRVGVRRAVAVSCNRYFQHLAESAVGIDSVAERFGLPSPDDGTPETLIGLGSGWRIGPAQLMRAYLELSLRRTEAGVAPLVAGLREAAKSGTGKGLGLDALVKTGTGPCVHGRGPGDGYAMVLYPSERPVGVLLVRVHSKPGAEAAVIAGELIKKGRGNLPRPFNPSAH